MDEYDLRLFAQRYGTALIRYAFLVCGDSERARDLVQSAYVSLLSTSSTVRSPLTYARKIIGNAAKRPLRITEVPMTSDVEVGSHENVILDRDAVWRELQRLPHRQRLVLVLRYYEQLEDVTIAETIGCRRATVRSLAARGLAALRPAVHGMQSERSTS